MHMHRYYTVKIVKITHSSYRISLLIGCLLFRVTPFIIIIILVSMSASKFIIDLINNNTRRVSSLSINWQLLLYILLYCKITFYCGVVFVG